MECRAIEWLADQRVIELGATDRAIAERPDLDAPPLSGALDAAEVARAVVHDLRSVYGERLRKVILFGSWARGDAHPESDVDLLVVLDRIESARKERDRMDELLWRHSFANDTVVSVLPVAEQDLAEQRTPALIRAQAEGREIR